MKPSINYTLLGVLCFAPLAVPARASIDAAAATPRSASDWSAPREPLALARPGDDPFRLREPGTFSRIQVAHAILVKSIPDKESTVTDAPEEILLVFNEGVGQEYLALAVVDESGHRVDQHDAKLDFTDRSHLRASVSKLNPGRYMVRYRVLSADGHVVSGKYFFEVHPANGGNSHAPEKEP